MLRGRRLLLPQTPLSAWGPSASTATPPTRWASSRPQGQLDGPRSDGDASADQANARFGDQKPSKEREVDRDQQDLTITTHKADREHPPHRQSLSSLHSKSIQDVSIIRKYSIPEAKTEPGVADPFAHLRIQDHPKLPKSWDRPVRPTEEVLTELHQSWGKTPKKTAENIPKTKDLSPRKQHCHVPQVVKKTSSGNRRAPKSPTSGKPAKNISRTKKSSSRQQRRHVQNVVKKTSSGYRQTPRSPTSKVNRARARQADLSAQGVPKLAPTRKRIPKYVRPAGSEPLSQLLRLQGSVQPAASKSIDSTAGKNAQSAASRPNSGTLRDSVQPAASEPVSGTLRNSLKNLENNAARPSPWAPSPEELAPWNSPFDTQSSGWQPYKGERAPTGIRFTVQPSWLPTGRPQWGRDVAEEEPVTSHSRDALNNSLKAEVDSESQQRSPDATDTLGEPAARLNSSASHAPPIDQPAEPEGIEPMRESAEGVADEEARPARIYRRTLEREKIRGGIFKQLFPDEPPAAADEAPRQEPPDDSIFISLRNEIRNWIPEEQRDQIIAPEPGEYGSHSTVVMLSGLSSSLVETDFYRILPEAKHIEGWAGGLVKVVQARDRLTYEPVGRYFLMFHSRPAADAYKAEVLRLHDLSKRLLHGSTGTGPLATAPADPQPFLTAAEQAAVRSFTLCPPTAQLRIHTHMWNTNLVREIAKDTSIADVVQALRPDMSTPAKVLVTVNTIPGSRVGAGGGLTADELWLTLRDDGRERGAPWVLANLKEGIMPVKLTSTSRHNVIDVRSEAMHTVLDGPIYDEVDMLAETHASDADGSGARASMRKIAYERVFTAQAKNEGKLGARAVAPEEVARRVVDKGAKYNRFVVTFAQTAVSRRFVRSWHKRAIWDAYENRSVSIDAVPLM